MRTLLLSFCLTAVLCLFSGPAAAQSAKPTDTIPTDRGDLVVTFLGHGTLMFQWAGKVVHVDPWTAQADYARLPKADLVLVTHEHFDHLDKAAVAAVHGPGTVIGASAKAAAALAGASVLKNGETKELAGIRVDAVPAYNRVHMRAPGQAFHPKGDGNGYVLHFGKVRVYVAGDTEDIPEMAALHGVDVAFLPVNLPYTMDIPMLVHAATLLKPRVLYPYHTGETDMHKAAEALRAVPGVETRIRPMK